VELDSTDYRGIVDSTGHFTIEDLLPGPYRPIVIDDAMSTIGVPLPTGVEFEAERDSVNRIQLDIIGAKTFTRMICANMRQKIDSAWVLGRVFMPSGAAADYADWRILRIGDSQQVAMSGRVGPNGVFASCVLHVGEHLRIGAERDDLMAVGDIPSIQPGTNVLSLLLEPRTLEKPKSPE
jgi:hypothetical protein